MLVGYSKLDVFRGDSPLDRWLRGIARLIHLRQVRKLTEALTSDGVLDVSDPEAAALSVLQRRQQLEEALAAAFATSMVDVAPAERSDGERPPRYVRVERLGAGGMGEVFAVLDQPLGRTVAMKVLRADRADADRSRWFAREARQVAQLEHPGIPPVHDVGVLDSGSRCSR